MVLGLILLLYPMASKTWLKNALHFTLRDRIFARVCFCKFFFIPSFRLQDSNSYYLVVAAAKIKKNWKRTSLGVYFSICKSQDCTINHQWIIQSKLIDCPSDTFFNFVIATFLHSTLHRKWSLPLRICSVNMTKAPVGDYFMVFII